MPSIDQLRRSDKSYSVGQLTSIECIGYGETPLTANAPPVDTKAAVHSLRSALTATAAYAVEQLVLDVLIVRLKHVLTRLERDDPIFDHLLLDAICDSTHLLDQSRDDCRLVTNGEAP